MSYLDHSDSITVPRFRVAINKSGHTWSRLQVVPVFKQTRRFTQLYVDSRHEMFLSPSSVISCLCLNPLFNFYTRIRDRMWDGGQNRNFRQVIICSIKKVSNI